MLTPAEQAERAAAGLHEHWRTQCGYIAGGEVAEHGGILVTATRLPDETLSCAFVPRRVTSPSALDWFEDWFTTRGLQPGIELRAGHHPEVERSLTERGYRVVVRRPAMSLHPIELPDATAPHVTVHRVTADADLAAFQSIQADAFAMTPDVATEFLPRRALDVPGIAFFLAYYEDVACGTAAVSVSSHGAGIVGVATLPAYRRRGVGRAVTATAVEHGKELGADLAWLYPSAMARRLYESLGFATLDETQVWVRPSPAR